METNEINQLARVLLENGADVLNGTKKLTLSSELLWNLNNFFSLVIDQADAMNSSFQVINSNKGNLEVFRDLQFLHDFVQRATGLKLTQSPTKQEYIDITKFKNLKLLEIHKLDVGAIYGIQTLRIQLQYLVCMRCLNYMSDILEKCGGDQSVGLLWAELKEAIFSHNGLQVIDSSLQFAPFLIRLDLSHNEIKDATLLNNLTSLKYLNLAYNKLPSVPAFKGQLCNRLQVLVLRNNFIEDISEVTVLSNLFELDLSENCLVEHNSLLPLANLATLQMLNLEGNPLCYHPQHRMKAASVLHLNTATVRFLLNRSILSKSEKRMAGTLRPRTIQTQNNSQPNLNQLELPLDKPRRIRNATISDSEQSPLVESSFPSITSLVTSGEHLETKRHIEQMREMYGEKWLVHGVLGLENTHQTSTPYGSVDYIIQDELKPNGIFEEKAGVSTTTEVTAEVYVTADETNPPENNESNLYPNETPEIPEIASEDEDLDLGEGEESIYLATIKGETDPVFIVITKTHILEKECTSAKERVRWPIDTLIRCENYETHLQLYFDTLKPDREKRQYILEDDESQKLQAVLNEIINNRSPIVNNIINYKCLKCSAQFGAENKSKVNSKECPVCKSQLVFEDV